MEITYKQALLGLAGVAIVASTSALAITDTAFNYAAPKDGYFSIAPMAMAPEGNVAAGDYYVAWPDSLEGNGCYNTGVNLPQGATIKSVSIWYASSGDSVFFSLQALNLGPGTSVTIVSGFAPATGGVRKGFAAPLAAPAKVGNAGQAYGFGVCLQDNETFRGARIDYTYQNAGD